MPKTSSKTKCQYVRDHFTEEEQEDCLCVLSYQCDGEQKWFNKLYERYCPRLVKFARRHGHLGGDEGDLLGEANRVFVDCVGNYRMDKTPFGAYLNQALRNLLVSQQRNTRALKRADAEGNPARLSTVSLDQEAERGGTLYDQLPAPEIDTTSAASVATIIDTIAGRDNVVRKVLQRFVQDRKIRNLRTACRLRSGTFRIAKWQRERLYYVFDKPKCVGFIKEMIHESNRFPKGFIFLNYQLYLRFVKFEVLDNDLAVYRRVRAAIKHSGLEKELAGLYPSKARQE